MTPRKFVAVYISVLFLTCFSFATDQSALELQMRQLLQNHILGLAMPYIAPDLKFDADGNLVGTSALGPWTMNSSIQVDNVAVKDASFEIDGERVILIVPNSKATVTVPTLTGRKVHLSLAIKPPVDEHAIRVALGNIFSGQNVDERFNSYWKPAVDMDAPCKAIVKEHPDGVVGTLVGNPVYACVKSNVVSKPKGASTPAPGAGSKKPMVGTAKLRIVVDDVGTPAIIMAKTASKGDYGQAALQAIAQWKYNPAMKDGKPVPYMLDIELGNAAPNQDQDKDND